MSTRSPVFLGLDAASWLPFQSSEELSGAEIDSSLHVIEGHLRDRDRLSDELRDLPLEIDRDGWGIVFPQEIDLKIREALRPLVELRRSQMGAECREFFGKEGYRLGESAVEFLISRAFTSTVGDRPRFPFHLLLVGGLDLIPLTLQLDLGSLFSVGRVDFDSLGGYQRYSEKVTGHGAKSRFGNPTAVFFGAANRDDYATALSSQRLLRPLEQKIGWFFQKNGFSWDSELILGSQALKMQLSKTFQGFETPSLLVTAGHTLVGTQPPNDHGDLVCQDWVGSSGRGRTTAESSCFGGKDLCGGGAAKNGVVFRFGSFSAGWLEDDGLALPWKTRVEPPVIRYGGATSLNQELLLRPGGPLAVIAQSGLTEVTSFAVPGGARQVEVYGRVMCRLVAGSPTGEALRFQIEELGHLGREVLNDTVNFGSDPFFRRWHRLSLLLGNHCGRRFVVLGDPLAKIGLG